MLLKKYILSVLIILPTLIIDAFAQKLPSRDTIEENRKVSPGKVSYYIDPQQGDDRNSGINVKKPWRTFRPINRLILSPGDLVTVLAPGIFRESLFMIAKGTRALPVNLKFAPGKYDLFPEDAVKKIINISNTNDNPEIPKSIALLFDKCTFTHITGAGANFVLRGKMIETYMNACKNIYLSGMSFDYHRPTVSELKVITVGANYADLDIHKDSKFSIKDSLLIWQGEGWNTPSGSYWQVLNLKNGNLSRLNIPMKELRFAALHQNHIRVYFRQNPGFEKDLIYQNRETKRDDAGIFIQRSKNIKLDHIRIYFMHGMGIVSQYCENVKISGVVVKPADSSGRTCAAWADILHFSGCKGLVEIRNSYLSAANDDAINIHGTHLKIRKILGPNRIIVRFMHPQTFGFNPFSIGDSLDLIRPQSLLPIESNLVLKTTMLNDKEVMLTLKNPMSALINSNDVVENTTATPKVWIHHNIITRIPTRGILTTTRRKIVIEKNTIKNCRMSGIFISDDASDWYESGIVKDLLISHNNFSNCGGPVIFIHPENTETNTIAVHRNIAVMNNTFNLEKANLFSAKSTADIKITGNTITTSNVIKKINELIDLQHCTAVDISDNKIIRSENHYPSPLR